MIITCVRWYLRFPLASEHVAELIKERRLAIDASSGLAVPSRLMAQSWREAAAAISRPTLKSYRVAETFIRIKGEPKHLYRAIDKHGQTIDFQLKARRDGSAARRFLHKALSQSGNSHPRVISVEKNPAYPDAVEALKEVR